MALYPELYGSKEKRGDVIVKTVWILGNAGPIEGENWRDYRNNQFGKYLSKECGYRVIWWTSNFSHHFKKYRSKGWKDIEVNENYIIRLVPSTSYKKNFSFGRFAGIAAFSINAGKRFKKEPKPDIIIGNCVMMKGYPMFQYGKKKHIPVIVDQGDIWPEFIERSLGKFAPIGHLFFNPIYNARKRNYYNADGLIALGKNYLDFAQNVASNGKQKPSALVYNGIDVDQFNEMAKAPIRKSIEKTINQKEGEHLCIFAGTFGPSYDIDAMLECAQLFEKDSIPVKFVFAGSGPRKDDIISVTERCNNAVYVGALKPEELIPLYVKCDIGMCAYTSKSNVDMPDKFYDYTAAGLAVVNSLTEEVAEYVKNCNVGLNYKASDVNELYQAIKQIVYSDSLAEMKANSKALSYQFDAKVQNAKLAALIEKLVE